MHLLGVSESADYVATRRAFPSSRDITAGLESFCSAQQTGDVREPFIGCLALNCRAINGSRYLAIGES